MTKHTRLLSAFCSWVDQPDFNQTTFCWNSRSHFAPAHVLSSFRGALKHSQPQLAQSLHFTQNPI